jgi:hypothetical protein
MWLTPTDTTKNKLMSLDATVIAFSTSIFEAHYRHTKRVVKLHLLLDREEQSFAVITEGKQHDVRVVSGRCGSIEPHCPRLLFRSYQLQTVSGHASQCDFKRPMLIELKLGFQKLYLGRR